MAYYEPPKPKKLTLELSEDEYNLIEALWRPRVRYKTKSEFIMGIVNLFYTTIADSAIGVSKGIKPSKCTTCVVKDNGELYCSSTGKRCVGVYSPSCPYRLPSKLTGNWKAILEGRCHLPYGVEFKEDEE